MLKRCLAALAAVVAFGAMAQTASTSPTPPACWPAELRGGTGGELKFYTLDTGYVACWTCPNGKTAILGGDVNTVLANVGGRLDTVKSARSSDLAASVAADASWKRNVTKDLRTAPEFARMREELQFRQICGWRPAAPASAASN